MGRPGASQTAIATDLLGHVASSLLVARAMIQVSLNRACWIVLPCPAAGRVRDVDRAVRRLHHRRVVELPFARFAIAPRAASTSSSPLRRRRARPPASAGPGANRCRPGPSGHSPAGSPRCRRRGWETANRPPATTKRRRRSDVLSRMRWWGPLSRMNATSVAVVLAHQAGLNVAEADQGPAGRPGLTPIVGDRHDRGNRTCRNTAAKSSARTASTSGWTRGIQPSR